MKRRMTISRLAFLSFLTILLASCVHVPDMLPLDSLTDRSVIEQCGRPFVKSPYRFVHAIEAGLPGGRTATLMGVTVVDPEAKSLHSVLMTLEGLVLFDGEYDGTLSVKRAVPPFDRDSFARNMMEDIRLLFLAPENTSAQARVSADGSVLCRYRGKEGETIDVTVQPDHTWRIETYATPFERFREIKAGALKDGMPGELELRGYSAGRYTLRLKLVDAEPVSAAAQPAEDEADGG